MFFVFLFILVVRSFSRSSGGAVGFVFVFCVFFVFGRSGGPDSKSVRRELSQRPQALNLFVGSSPDVSEL